MSRDSNEITREWFDRICVKTRLIDADLPELRFSLWGAVFETPVTTAALSHLNGLHEKGTSEMAKGALMAGALNFCGMESYDGETDDILATGAKTVRIIKPHAEDRDVFQRIERALKGGAFAVGMDIDHAFSNDGGYDVVNGLPMRPKTLKQLKAYTAAAGATPFVVKGVLSVEDALKCAEAGAKGIVVSHHHGIMPSSVTPLRVLPEIRRAVGKDMTIFVDCGFESGMDIYKALALGADAVSVGRALMEPLKENGAEGLKNAIDKLTAELSVTMARTGFHDLASLDDSCLMFE